MAALFCFFLALLASPFKSSSRFEAENAALRHQLMVLQRKVHGRVHFTNSDRLFFVQLYRWFPSTSRPPSLTRKSRYSAAADGLTAICAAMAGMT